MNLAEIREPKVVVFDLGKVLLHFDYRIAARKLRLYCRGSEDEILGLIDQSPLLLSYERGGLNSIEFFEKFRQASGFSGTFAQFKPSFAEIFRPIPEMIALLETLNEAGVPTCLFSNTNEIAFEHILATYPFVASFKRVVLSFEQASIKPESPIYEKVEELTGAKNGDLLYIDDRPENIEAAARREWQTILHADPEITIRSARERFPNLRIR